MSRLLTSHPSDGDLLRYADSEVSGREAKEIETHLAACWQCRTELAELQSTISECVRYRRTVLQFCLPDAPAAWCDIHRRFAELDESRRSRPLAERLLERLQAAAVRPWRWSVAAALLVIVWVLVDQLRNAPSVQAAELLRRAVVAAESRPKTPRRIQMRTRTGQATRLIEAAQQATQSPQEARTLAVLEPLFHAARYDWEDPLSARSFAAWRNALAEKRDEVTAVAHPRAPERMCYRIRTTTSSSEVVEATLKLRMDDLRPVEGTLHFRDREWVEITEMEGPAVPPMAAAESAEPGPAQPLEPTVAEHPSQVTRDVTPGEELRVFATLRRLGADLGEPVEVTRDGERIVVAGMGVNPELGQRIHDELQTMPRVVVRFADPPRVPVPPATRTTGAITLSPEIARLQADMEKHLGGRAAYERFADEVLEISETLMSRLHALRRLAERFQPEAESRLAADERQLLRRLCREHAVAVADLAVALEERSRTALVPPGATAAESPAVTPLSGSWQAATEDLFRQGRHSESLLAAMLGGAATEVPAEALPVQALGSLAQLRAMAAEYARNSLD